MSQMRFTSLTRVTPQTQSEVRLFPSMDQIKQLHTRFSREIFEGFAQFSYHVGCSQPYVSIICLAP